MHLLLAALLEGQQTHSETVNEKGVWAAGEVELKVMYILVRAGILQTWHDVFNLCVTYIFISFKKSYEWGGEGKGKRVFEVQNDIHVRLFRKTKSCTAISLAWEWAP